LSNARWVRSTTSPFIAFGDVTSVVVLMLFLNIFCFAICNNLLVHPLTSSNLIVVTGLCKLSDLNLIYAISVRLYTFFLFDGDIIGNQKNMIIFSLNVRHFWLLITLSNLLIFSIYKILSYNKI
jgi:hypothetical protein